ncbi:flavodoxin family protein [Clostridium sp. SHJSY1]|uniref:flavodoxin family protein n=1 Tax=Clostridium sp. SHJSY1 TaxID=2942483 RepID=UPI0028764F05|nr:flavodoxin family protein [Clostridium sp. SHJSY1]MDS0528560.1 flavodoxin family protein [Clostridium sp. SHJSY1]
MNYKVLGITAGRKNSNSEILLKEALLACKEQGAEVKMINLRDYKILDCTGCTACTHAMTDGKYIGCTLDEKDDKKAIMDIMLKQDAVIFSVPTYDLMPSATFLKFMQRSLAYATSFLEAIGVIEHKDRIGAIISVGGSTRSWQSMALEGIQATAFTTDFKIIDMYLAARAGAPKQCLLHDNMIIRAHKVGENIMKSLTTPIKERTWLGDKDMGWCPNCHSNALILGEPQWDGLQFPIECQVCGAGGDLEKTKDGKWKFVIAENGLCRDRTTSEGIKAHLDEISHTQGGFYTKENLAIVKEKFVKYKKLNFSTIEINKK